MNKITEFLKQAQTFYLATTDGNKPKLRPFGAVSEFEGKTYIVTSNTKNVYKQMLKNPNISICACMGRKWVRVEGQAKRDPRAEAKQQMLKDNPMLSKHYASVGDTSMEVFYIDNMKAEFNE